VSRVNLVGIRDAGTGTDANGKQICQFRQNVEGGPGQPALQFNVDDMTCSLQNQVAWGLGPVDYAFVDGPPADGINDCVTCDPLVQDRTYHVFFDDGNRTDSEHPYPDAYPHLGQGSVEDDFRPIAANVNNFGPAYVLNDLWDGHTFLHETMHNLGSVQHEAVHSTWSHHCTEEFDAMCQDDPPYGDGWVPDGSGTGSVHYPFGEIVSCDRADWKLDCGRDDYWNPSGSIIGRSGDPIWNVATSRFLTIPR
jgi:hypothetical protein